MPEASLTLVNPHYMGRVMTLAADKQVVAAEDIYAQNGIKLVTKGTRLASDMQDRLIIHRLRKPLESSLSVDDGVGLERILTEARGIVEEIKPLQPLLGSLQQADSPLKLLAQIRFNDSLSLLLTMLDQSDKSALKHCLVVAMIAGGMARKLGLTDDAIQSVTLAGLFHDVGELYIDPVYLQQDRPLKPSEWRHIVVHPVIGQKLIEEVGGFRRHVSRAILEHHERADGYGYPRRLDGNVMSIEGQLLAVAETIGVMFQRYGSPLERAALALRLLPREHPREAVSLLSRALKEGRLLQQSEPVPAGESSEQCAHAVLLRIGKAAQLCGELGEARAMAGAKASRILELTRDRLNRIQRAFTSTGLETACAEDTPWCDDDIRFEMCLVVSEIHWRLRELGRDLVLRMEELTAAEQAELSHLVEALHGEELAIEV